MDRRRFIQASALLLTSCKGSHADAPGLARRVSDMSVVKHFAGQEISQVQAGSAGSAAALPGDSVAILPGVYVFNGVAYQCTAPGRYLFWDGVSPTIHARLVYGGEIYGFLSGVSWHHAHGVADEGLTGQDLANVGRTHKWRLRCGYVADLMMWWLPQYGYTCRKVQALTLEPLNGVDDGHIMFEVLHDAKWKMWDITNGCYFSKDGAHLSLGEIVAAGADDCERVPIDGDAKGSSDLAGTFDMGSYRDLAFGTEDQLDAWYARVFQSWSVM